MLPNRIRPKVKKILKKIKTAFEVTSQILTIYRIIEEVRRKYRDSSLLLEDFSKEFDSTHRQKMAQSDLHIVFPKIGLQLK